MSKYSIYHKRYYEKKKMEREEKILALKNEGLYIERRGTYKRTHLNTEQKTKEKKKKVYIPTGNPVGRPIVNHSIEDVRKKNSLRYYEKKNKNKQIIDNAKINEDQLIPNLNAVSNLIIV